MIVTSFWLTNICVNTFWSNGIGALISLSSPHTNSSPLWSTFVGNSKIFSLQIFRVCLKSCRWLASYSGLCIQPFTIYLQTLIDILTHFDFTLPKLLSKWKIVTFEENRNLHLPEAVFGLPEVDKWIWETQMSCFLWNWNLQLGQHFLLDFVKCC